MSGSDHVKPAGSGVKLTYDDFILFPDDGKRHELIDGEHYVTPSPNMRHQQISMNLVLLIGNWLEQHPVGRLFLRSVRCRLFEVRRRRARSLVRLE
jgi:Uma2 family endonuclease